MRSSNWLFVAAIALTGCIDGLTADQSSRQDVVIEGVPHVVFRVVSAENAYQARETSLAGGIIDPNDYRQNILAIEAVSGCTVDRGTVVNQGLTTIAAVAC